MWTRLLLIKVELKVRASQVLSPDMAKLSSEKIVQETNHRWRSTLCSKEDMTRPVVGGWVGEPFHSFLLLFLVPSTSTSSVVAG